MYVEGCIARQESRLSKQKKWTDPQVLKMIEHSWKLYEKASNLPLGAEYGHDSITECVDQLARSVHSVGYKARLGLLKLIIRSLSSCSSSKNFLSTLCRIVKLCFVSPYRGGLWKEGQSSWTCERVYQPKTNGSFEIMNWMVQKYLVNDWVHS